MFNQEEPRRLRMLMRVFRHGMGPTRILALGFAGVILLGGVLLRMPFSTHAATRVSFLDALFTATSAVCVTGLNVVEPGAVFTGIGQGVILVLIQVGGLGFMTMATLIMMVMGKRISLKSRLVIQESMNVEGVAGLVRLIRWVVGMTFTIEALGALLLSLRWVPMFGWKLGVIYSIFHSVSAFCNAGFDIFGQSNSLAPFASDPLVVLTICGLIVLGGLGFATIRDVKQHWRTPRLFSLHTKLVLTMTTTLIVIGTLVYFALESGNLGTLGAPGIRPWARPLMAFMQSVTTRTAGFATFSQAELRDASKLFSVVLMFIGASPASTGGGVKTTTLAVVLAVLYSVIRGSEDVHIFGRRLPRTTVMRATAILLVSLVALLGLTMLLAVVEQPEMPAEASLIDLLFETASALATVGLSANLTPSLTIPGRVMIMLLMFMGRVGPLTLTLAFARRLASGKQALHYPEGHIMVG